MPTHTLAALSLMVENERNANMVKLAAGHKDPFRLSPRMIDALRAAAGRWDRTVLADRRTYGALADRGLVDLYSGRGTDRYGGTVYGVLVDVKINQHGRRVVELLDGRK
ncbi:hypothetical protein I5G67_gp089 [Mycobacterium phage Aminay]|uniref:Uncharacterized protein n=1 Tax=Mycobacterium phage Aminay TaxID=2250291 RepID=A0A345KV73_9CAUD|nr:hypothetical protein I5G67_gp089 [Mycobacterium phage Aminay]AXH46925.1 hypothetical protein SEA_AMINAY_89 [Mycobacterium phage Aminay]